MRRIVHVGRKGENKRWKKLGGEVKGPSELELDHAKRDATRWAGGAGHSFLLRMEISAPLNLMEREDN